MSISIGRNRVFNQVDNPLLIHTSFSNTLLLNSDTSNVIIVMDNYELGQRKSSNGSVSLSFDLNHKNEKLSSFTPTLASFLIDALFTSNVTIEKSLIIQQNISSSVLNTCNLELTTLIGDPVTISSNNQLLLNIRDDNTLYYAGKIGVGVYEPNYQFEVSDSLYVHSNIKTDTLILNQIKFGSNGSTTRIEITSNLILLDADTVQINNPVLTGEILFEDISIINADIDRVFASNVYVYNKYLDQSGIYISQLNSIDPPYFADTLNGNPITVDSYFYNVDATLRTFQVDTFGRISSGKTTASFGTPDYGFSYYIQQAREDYHSGFMNLETYKPFEQTIINSKGYLSIGSNVANHPLHITNPFTGFEANYVPNTSLIGLYQNTSNNGAFMRCFDCNMNYLLTLSSNGNILFGQHHQYDPVSYKLENSYKTFLNYLHVNKIYSQENIDCSKSTFSNIQQLYTCNIDVAYGVLSNVHAYSMSIDSLRTNAFECIDDLNDYEEFRIHSPRFLFYGSNMVMNPNRYFFQYEQPSLPDDNLRIYANGGPTRNVNVIHTIANNNYSTIRMTNCNTAINSVARIELIANENSYTFGVINKSTIEGALSEAFITNNPSLVTDNRQLNITSTGCRIGGQTGVHLQQTGKITINNTIDTTTNLNVKGNVAVYTDTPTPLFSMVIDKTNPYVGINTSVPYYNLHVNGTMFVNSNNITSLYVTNTGNVGIGTNTVRDGLDVIVPATFRHIVNCTSNVIIGGRLDTLGNVASTSDSRLKEDLIVIPDSLNKIDQLTGYTYYRKDIQQYETGLIAQDVQKVLPEAVHSHESGYYTLSYGNMAGLFVEAIKALKKENEELRESIKHLLNPQ